MLSRQHVKSIKSAFEVSQKPFIHDLELDCLSSSKIQPPGFQFSKTANQAFKHSLYCAATEAPVFGDAGLKAFELQVLQITCIAVREDDRAYMRTQLSRSFLVSAGQRALNLPLR
jgi:hypothetical protein